MKSAEWHDLEQKAKTLEDSEKSVLPDLKAKII
jgi:hypothetical protein